MSKTPPPKGPDAATERQRRLGPDPNKKDGGEGSAPPPLGRLVSADSGKLDCG